jgi:hypothetical protein
VRVRVAIPDRHLDAGTLDALLEATTRAGTRQIRSGEAPDIRASLARGLAWKPEPYIDGEHFDLPALASSRGWGDCDDLGPWLAASLRASGEDPRARARATRSGPNRWHVVTQRGDGSIIDPSKAAGMGRGRASVSGPGASVHAAAARPMALPGDAAIAVKRARGAWWSRCDLPWGSSHLASLSCASQPEAALRSAVQGALSSSDGCTRDHRVYAHRLVSGMLVPPGADGSIFGRGSFRNGRSVVRSLVSGIGGAAPAAAPYGAQWRQTPTYRAFISAPPSSASWWIDPLVSLLFSNAPALETLGPGDVAAVLEAVEYLDGFHAGQWPAVSKSLDALSSALAWAKRFGGLDKGHIQDTIGNPVSAMYDSRVAAERSDDADARAAAAASAPPSSGHVQLTMPGGAHVVTPTTGGSIIVRF